MLQDIVIDTNVLVHASDIRQKHQTACIEFITLLKDSTTSLCVDEGYDWEESKNRSKIISEYQAHLRHGSLGYIVVALIAQSGRIQQVSTKVENSVRKIINQLVYDPTDRVYLKVASNTSCRTLVSHDFSDIPQKSRASLLKKITLSVHAADDVMPLLRERSAG